MTTSENLVLIVDDDKAVRDSLKFSLELEGLDVQVCAAGSELLERADLELARCLVLDYKMPVMNGVELLEDLRRRQIHIPAILITGHATLALRQRAAAAGARLLVEKPLLDSALLDTIRSILDGPVPLSEPSV